uniref:Secreted protein n=1 Tax=Timema tahoe TaxID=61484 RepID=A0A7R9NVP4_9NEOP|nr:unnamed protein product [Timema tahoe]
MVLYAFVCWVVFFCAHRRGLGRCRLLIRSSADCRITGDSDDRLSLSSMNKIIDCFRSETLNCWPPLFRVSLAGLPDDCRPYTVNTDEAQVVSKEARTKPGSRSVTNTPQYPRRQGLNLALGAQLALPSIQGGKD